MKKQSYNFLVAAFLLALVAGASFAKPKKARDLAASLPDSDGIVSLDIQKLTTVALPQVLSEKPDVLAKINSELDKIREKSGLDLRQFDRIVVGLTVNKISDRQFDVDPLLLARGKVGAGSLIALAKVASKGKYREENVDGKIIYVFSLTEIAKEKKPDVGNSMLDLSLDGMLNKLAKELAVSAYDENTVAIGSVARVTEALRKSSVLAPKILAYSQRKPNAVMSFGIDLPDGAASFIDLDNDELGQTLSSMRSIFGVIDIEGSNANLTLGAKSTNLHKAQSLQELLEGLKLIGKSFLGGMKGEERNIFSRMIDGAKIGRTENEVTLDVSVPQTDINWMISRK